MKLPMLSIVVLLIASVSMQFEIFRLQKKIFEMEKLAEAIQLPIIIGDINEQHHHENDEPSNGGKLTMEDMPMRMPCSHALGNCRMISKGYSQTTLPDASAHKEKAP